LHANLQRKCPVLTGSRQNQGVCGVSWRIGGRLIPSQVHSRSRGALPDYGTRICQRIWSRRDSKKRRRRYRREFRQLSAAKPGKIRAGRSENRPQNYHALPTFMVRGEKTCPDTLYALPTPMERSERKGLIILDSYLLLLRLRPDHLAEQRDACLDGKI